MAHLWATTEHALSLLSDHAKELEDLFFVSVGCGLAKQETLFMLKLGLFDRKRMFLVDPDPLSFGGKQWLQCDYPLVVDLLQERPDVKGKCFLVLWNSDPDWIYYDIEAVRLLEPVHVLIAYEANFTSAGYLMHAWLARLGLKRDRPNADVNEVHRPERWFPSAHYIVRSSKTWHAEKDAHGEPDFRIAWLTKVAPATAAEMFDPDFSIYKKEFSKQLSLQERMWAEIAKESKKKK